MQTQRQRRGSAAETLAVRYLIGLGWSIVARNVRVEYDEIDIVSVDPGPPAAVVAVEVRSASSIAFGAPEERVDRAKVLHLYRAAGALSRSGTLHEVGIAARQVRVDLVIVDRRGGTPAIRHIRQIEPV